MKDVLVVDDGSEYVDRILDAFAGADIGVRSCRPGEVVRLAGSDGFDSVVCPGDVDGADGVHLLARLGREDPGLATVAVVDDAAALSDAQRRGVDRVLTRDGDPGAVVAAVRETRTDILFRECRSGDADIPAMASRILAGRDGATSPAEVARLVSESLAELEPCVAAWVSRLDQEAAELVPETAVGIDLGALGPVSVPDGFGTDRRVQVRHVGTATDDRFQTVIAVTAGGSCYGAVHLVTTRRLTDEEVAAVRLVCQSVLGSAETGTGEPDEPVPEAGESDEPEPASTTRRYARTLSHELRNQLQIAWTQLDEMDETDETDERSEEVETLESVLDRIERLTGEAEFVADPAVDPDELDSRDLERTARDAWEWVSGSDATLSVTDSAPVVADHDLLELLLVNLFRNSVAHGGPDVAVSVGVTDGGDGFYVADSGPGIDPDERDRVFEWGYAPGGGSGFGLAIVERIVDLHGWEVAVVESDRGGARFDVTGVTVG